MQLSLGSVIIELKSYEHRMRYEKSGKASYKHMCMVH